MGVIMSENISSYSSESNQLVDDAYVVGIGASAGGLEAIEQFFSHLTADTGMIYVLVQHLSVKYKSFMPELLSKKTNMNIVRIADGLKAVPNTIYLNPPHHYITIENGVFRVEEYDKNVPNHFPIDRFFNSLAEEKKDKAISIIFSGNGTDGTEGVKAIKECGGMVIVQEEESAKFENMPKSVIHSGYADYIELPAKIPTIFQTMLEPATITYMEETLNQIFHIIHKRTGINFSNYKKSSILRRMEKRMNVLKGEVHSMESYYKYLEKNADEIDLLQKDLLINVTEFFRDPKAFNEVERLIPDLVKHKVDSGADEIRLWSVGCSTGQEAYSLAIILDRYLKSLDYTIDFRIFATDVDRETIKSASDGIYDKSLISSLPESLTSHYFDEHGEKYQVKKFLRKKIVFAPHNITKDSPFVNIDLISCRNMMIYFQPELQQKILSLFHFSLVDNGILFLGPSETIGKLTTLFEPIHSKWKIYRSRSGGIWEVREPTVTLDNPKKEQLSRDLSHSNSFFEVLPTRKLDVLYQNLINEFMDPCIIINEKNEVILTSKSANKLLTIPIGQTNYSIHKLVPTPLSVIIGTALKKLTGIESEIHYKGIAIKINDEEQEFDLTIRRLAGSDTLTVLSFHKKDVSIEKDHFSAPIYFDPNTSISERVIDLEQELFYTQQNLQTTIEELETSNEELQSTNEELIASNEELQSTNEELQSVNEELLNVNNEFESKISELTSTTNDLDNLLVNTSIATIFLDKALNIKLFTPEIQKIINILEMDIGRPFFHLTHNLEFGSLLQIAEQVLRTSEKMQYEIKSRDDRWYTMKAMPYRTGNNIIDGVVITFTDITDIKASNQKLMFTSSVIEQTPTSICITDKHGKIEFANARFRKHLGIEQEQIENTDKTLFEFYEDFLHATISDEIWANMLTGEAWVGDISYYNEDKQEIWESVSMLPILNEDGTLANVLRIAEDITERVKSEDMLKKSEMLSAVGQLAAGIAHEIRNPLTSLKGFLQLMMQSNEYNKEYTEVMFSEFNRLELIISEFLVLAKPQALSFQSLSLEKVLEDVHILLNTQAILKNVQIEMKVQEDIPFIYGNEKELKQLFINMIKNGIEAMEEMEGAIRIVVSMEKTEKVLVQIIDQGKGIPKEQLQKMGQPFFTTKEKGTGLGLMISQKIVANHHGTLHFQSELGVGTTVEVRFPVEKKLS